MIRLSFKQLDKNAVLPCVNHDTDAGYDIYSIEDATIQPGKTKTIRTGIALQMSFDFIPFDIKDRIPGTIHQDQMAFVQDFEYYLQEWIKQNYKLMFQIEARSGLASKEGLSIAAGVVDQDFMGEIKIILVNNTQKSYKVLSGDRIAQGIPKALPKISSTVWVQEFEQTTERGSNGLGSSGK